MSSFTVEDLNLCLCKSLIALDARSILESQGIPASTPVMVQVCDESGKTIGETPLPESSSTVQINHSGNARKDIIAFLNKADALFQLLEIISSLSGLGMPSTAETISEKQYTIDFLCLDSRKLGQVGEAKNIAISKFAFGIKCPCPPRLCCAG